MPILRATKIKGSTVTGACVQSMALLPEIGSNMAVIYLCCPGWGWSD